MKNRVLNHFRFGLLYGWIRRITSSRRGQIRAVRKLYLQIGLENCGCLLCNSTNFTLLAQSDRYGFDLNKNICNDCGLIQTNPALKPNFLSEFYAKHYRRLYTKSHKVDYAKLIDEQVNRGASIRDFILDSTKIQSLSDFSVVEIGCSSGGLLYELSKDAKNVQGCDLDSEAINYAQNVLNLHAEVSALPSSLPESPRIFVISHVLEHMSRPLETLEKIYALMNLDDYLYIEVPGINMVAEGDYKFDLRRYFHIAHVTDFSGTTLLSMAKLAGFEAISHNEKVQAIFRKSQNKTQVIQKSATDSIENVLRIESVYQMKRF